MIKLLVPTDFSDCASYATDFAMALAPQLNAEVHLYTRLQVHPNWEKMTEAQRAEHPTSQANLMSAKACVETLEQKYAHLNVPLVKIYSSGDLIEVVSKYVDEEGIDMIIMGSNGADGLKELFFGSNAQKVVRNAHCPVWVIKHPVQKTSIKHIVFASDFREESLKPFEKLLSICEPLNAHLHLLYVDTVAETREVGANPLGNLKRFEEKCGRIPCTVHRHGDLTVELGVTHFANEFHADLIAMVHYGPDDFLHRLMQGSISESMVNHLETPILVFNSKSAKIWEPLEAVASI